MTTPRIDLGDTPVNVPVMTAEHHKFREAVTRARQEAASTRVYGTDGILAAVIMPVRRVTQEDARARAAAFARQEYARAGLDRAARQAARPDVVTRLAQLFAVLTGADAGLLQDTEEFLSGEGASQDDMPLAERIERYLRHG